jgi:hypothetical protein
LDAPVKTIHPNDGSLMQTAGNQLMLVARLNLKGNGTVIRADYARGTSDSLASGRRRRVSQFDFRANRPFVGLEKRGQRFPRCPLEQADQSRGA